MGIKPTWSVWREGWELVWWQCEEGSGTGGCAGCVANIDKEKMWQGECRNELGNLLVT